MTYLLVPNGSETIQAKPCHYLSLSASPVHTFTSRIYKSFIKYILILSELIIDGDAAYKSAGRLDFNAPLNQILKPVCRKKNSWGTTARGKNAATAKMMLKLMVTWVILV